MLEKLENEHFSEFGWKSRKTIGFSPALAGKAGILFLGLLIIIEIIGRKTIISINSIKGERIVQYHVAFFHQVNTGLAIFPMFCQGGW